MSDDEPPRKKAREHKIQVAAGAIAGFCEVCLMHPLDLVKTRLQVSTFPGDPRYYTGIVDCITQMYRNEGMLSFYKGILPPLAAETPKRAIKFLSFETYSEWLNDWMNEGSKKPSAKVAVLAGILAGLTEGLFITPFEAIKVKLQTNLDLAKQTPSSLSVFMDTIKKDGLGTRGAFLGLTATLWRNAVFNCFFLGFNFSVRPRLPAHLDRDHPYEMFALKFALGFTSGILGSLANIPFDVAKSRIQGPQPVPGKIKYKDCFQTMALIYREEGWWALYKGLAPKVLRIGPGGAFLLLSYEYIGKYLNRVLP